MSPALRLSLVVALLAPLARCTAGDPPPAGQCEFDSDCDAGLVCSGTTCRAQCRVDSDCGSNARCLPTESNALACVPNTPEASACLRDSDCAAGRACLAGRCRALCLVDYDCHVINPLSRCASGACQAVCPSGSANCAGDGVCVSLSSLMNCGACGRACATGQACVSGACVTTCASPRTVCSGACVDTATDVANCGACGRACALANATPRCERASCVVASCATGFADCDAASANGCEVALASNVDHCGACGRACPAVSNAARSCAEGACGFLCNEGFYRSGEGCSQVSAPRLAGPLSGAYATTRRPVFRWSLPERGADGARIQICRDRACTTVETTFDVTGSSGSPTAPLSAGVHFWRALGRQGTAVGTTPSSATFEIVIPARDATRNTAWGSYPDFNADGFADVIVGEPGASLAHVYYGSATGLPASPSVALGMPKSNDFGKSVAVAGDIDGDGFIDAVVSAPGSRALSIHYGSPTGLNERGEVISHDAFEWGYVTVGAGDLNGDGFADLAVWEGFETRRVSIVDGGPRGVAPTITTMPNTSAIGAIPVAAAGKFNDDEYDDLVLGLLTATGMQLAIYQGGAMGVSPLPSSTALVQQFNAVSPAGDVNGDGFADLIVGASRGEGGDAELFLGSSTGAVSTPSLRFPQSDNPSFGASVAGGGDLNGDGFADLAIGDGTSLVQVFLGSASPTASGGITLTGARGDFSSSLSIAGDVDRDGFADLLVGAPLSGSKLCNGEVLLFRGTARGVSTTAAITLSPPDPTSCDTVFGYSIAWNMRWPARLFLG